MPRNPNGAGIMSPAPQPRVNAAQRRTNKVAANYFQPGQRVNAADRRMINQGLVQDPRNQGGGRAPQQSFQPQPQLPKAQMPYQPPQQQPQPGMPPRNTGPAPMQRPWNGNFQGMQGMPYWNGNFQGMQGMPYWNGNFQGMQGMPYRPGPQGPDPSFQYPGYQMQMPTSDGLQLNFQQRPQFAGGVQYNGGSQGFNENASAARPGVMNMRQMYGGPYRG